jgi:hypothetical protein
MLMFVKIIAGVTFAILRAEPPVGWLDQLACRRLA